MVHLKALRNFSMVHMVHIATHLHIVIPHHPIPTDHRPIPTDHLRIPTDNPLIAMDHHLIPTMDHQHHHIATDLHMESPDSQPVSLNHPVSLKFRAIPRSPKSPPTQLILIHHHYPQTPTPPPSLTTLPTPLPHRHQTVLHHRPENQPLTALKERSHQGHRNGSNSLHLKGSNSHHRNIKDHHTR